MKQTGFVGGPGGEIVKYDPNIHAPKAQAKPLTRHQRATLYFTALRYIQALFREVGFKAVTLDTHSTFTIELQDFILEMSVQIPPPMAHITSYRGYHYDPEKVTAKVTSMSPGQPGEYVIRVIGTLPNMRTMAPHYVVVDSESPDPLKEAFRSALTAARDMIRHDPGTMSRIRSALANRDLEKDFERFRAEDASNHLPG